MNEEVIVECPVCSPEEPVEHEIMRAGQNPVVQCQECGAVHTTIIEEKKPIITKIIVSKDDISFTLHAPIDSEDMLYIDDELVVDDEHSDEVYPIIVTAIESEGRRVDRQQVEKIDVVWGRATDEVTAKISLKVRNGSTSLEKKVPGEFEFVVGGDYNAGGKSYHITRIKIRDGGFRSRKGDSVAAKYIKRIYSIEKRRTGWGEGKSSWSQRDKRY